METLSPYRIKWVVIDNCSSGLNERQETKLIKLGFSVMRNKKKAIVVKHYISDEAVNSDYKNIKSAWIVLKCKGQGVVITDKQFGMADSNRLESYIYQATLQQIHMFKNIVNR